ncbi:MAG TPA: TA system VapC family ribonuclease toxin [Terriglobia bacterium]|nr:TA system VapC family ribonuclease toxin [Terriglobia bacterium]
MKSYFPDINVWVALAYRGHRHHPAAASWFERAETSTLAFCRFTQLGFLRLPTHPAVMGDEVKTQREAWKAYDRLLDDSRVSFRPEPEPDDVGSELRSLTATEQFAPQQWPDAYLTAFARVAALTLVTFDRALSKLAGAAGLVLR